MSDSLVLQQPVWPAPAKLNLFLHITGQRANGFHDLQTVFQFLDFGDKLRFCVRADGQLRRVTDVPGVPETEDLMIRAARLLQTETGCTQGVEIHIEKNLPMGGGLGGGSSDAATTLVALNDLWQLGLDEDRLAALGLQLGADVPVFVRGRAAWAEGVGEKLEPVILPQPWFVVLVPGVQVSTVELFRDTQLTRDARPIKIRDYLSWVSAGGAGSVSGALFCRDGESRVGNVFEPLVRAKYPEVDAALMALMRFSPARLTGTGGCVFAAFERESQAREVAEQLEGRWQTIVSAGCNRSVLFGSERF
ncbi:MAG: 4-(cytidine 5'-diphospho)-2-C-methyl-D-erythritol kinase [Gammaproteobacteria bacterium]|nr:4-(cytidine 5'-diphospho)-2-C-methyl-D-erythritol kinase [Gammaproteobacteria bacterium]MCF6259889.1 4-(cytidine 5'-diphospho)-2-C-methyl-D-erythritol kinase [Gammaproteobacteria bacterium]